MNWLRSNLWLKQLHAMVATPHLMSHFTCTHNTGLNAKNWHILRVEESLELSWMKNCIQSLHIRTQCMPNAKLGCIMLRLSFLQIKLKIETIRKFVCSPAETIHRGHKNKCRDAQLCTYLPGSKSYVS